MLKTLIDRFEATEDISLLDALYFVKSAWSIVSAKTIQNFFVLAGFKTLLTFPIEQEDISNHVDVINTYCLLRNIETIDFDQYVHIDDNQIVCATSESTIVENINTAFIRFLRHVLIDDCLTIRTCSDYFETEGGFLY